MPRATFAAGAGLTRKSSLNGKQGTSFAGLRPGLGRAGVTKALSLVGQGGGLNPKTVYYMNQVGGVGRGHSRKCGGPPCGVMRYSSPTPAPTHTKHTPTPAPTQDQLSTHKETLRGHLRNHMNSYYPQYMSSIEDFITTILKYIILGSNRLCVLDRKDSLALIDINKDTDCCDDSQECWHHNRVLNGLDTVDDHHREGYHLSSTKSTKSFDTGLIQLELCFSELVHELELLESDINTLRSNLKTYFTENFNHHTVQHIEQFIEKILELITIGEHKLCVLDRQQDLVLINSSKDPDCLCDNSEDCNHPDRVFHGMDSDDLHVDNYNLSSNKLPVTFTTNLVQLELCLRSLIPTFMDDLDTNEDDLVQLDEWIDGGEDEAIFNMVDTNDDGVLDVQEMIDHIEINDVDGDGIPTALETLAASSVLEARRLIGSKLAKKLVIPLCYAMQIIKEVLDEDIIKLQNMLLQHIRADNCYDGQNHTLTEMGLLYRPNTVKQIVHLPFDYKNDYVINISLHYYSAKGINNLKNTLNNINQCVPNIMAELIDDYITGHPEKRIYFPVNCDILENDACTITGNKHMYLEQIAVNYEPDTLLCQSCHVCNIKSDLQGVKLDTDSDEMYHCSEDIYNIIMYTPDNSTLQYVVIVDCESSDTGCKFMQGVKNNLMTIFNQAYGSIWGSDSDKINDLVSDIILKEKDTIHDARYNSCQLQFNLNTFKFTHITHGRDCSNSDSCSSNFKVHHDCSEDNTVSNLNSIEQFLEASNYKTGLDHQFYTTCYTDSSTNEILNVAVVYDSTSMKPPSTVFNPITVNTGLEDVLELAHANTQGNIRGPYLHYWYKGTGDKISNLVPGSSNIYESPYESPTIN